MSLPRLALLPLDERPVNTGLVRDVVAIAGAELSLPPASAMPRYRTPGDPDALANWLGARAGDSDAIVASVDTLVHGGLVPARTSADSLLTCLQRLEVLRAIRLAHPGLRISAVSLVTRASDSYSAVEEPDYWSAWGRDLHRLGAETHRTWLAGHDDAASLVPQEVRGEHAWRRLRNHQVNLAALELLWQGVLDHLSLTADDTAGHSAGTAEQSWFAFWQTLVGNPRAATHPGADETGAVLVAQELARAVGGQIRVTILAPDPAALELTPPYENVPFGEALARQLQVTGSVPAPPGRGEVAVVVHGPDPDRGDHFAIAAPTPDSRAVMSTADAVENGLALGLPVVVADVRYANGGDTALVDELHRRGVLVRLAGYAGWNTAGNALGSALATAVATAVGARAGSLDAGAAGTALRRRLLDDAAYQGEVRRESSSELFGDRIEPVEPVTVRHAESVLRERLSAVSRRWGLDEGYPLAKVQLPWMRSFEVDLTFHDPDGSLR